MFKFIGSYMERCRANETRPNETRSIFSVPMRRVPIGRVPMRRIDAYFISADIFTRLHSQVGYVHLMIN